MVMASHTLSPIAISPSTSYPPSVRAHAASSLLLPWGLSSNSFVVGQRLSIRPSNFRNLPLKRRNSVATVLLSLPTAKTDREIDGKNPIWSSRSIRSFSLSKLEARKLKYPQTGTESLLMGILVEGTSIAAKFLRANGITLFKVREETVKLLGKSDLYFFSPESPPLTKPAQRALDWAVDEKLKSGETGEITVTHILLGIWSDQDSAGHRILASLGFDDDKAKELAKSMDKDFVASYN